MKEYAVDLWQRAKRAVSTTDYGGLKHVTPEQAGEAIQAARRIIQAVGSVAPPLKEANA